ncbi:MAG: TlpA family protein disulfide reductase [Anaeromyxobacteraceae bacterium]
MTVAARAAAIVLALVASAAVAAVAEEPPRLRPWTRGETPALAGVDVAGRHLDLKSLRGRVVLVQFWASWCEPCAEELPALAKLRASHRGRPFEVVTVNYGEGPARVEQFLREHAVNVPVLLDRDRRAAVAWGVGGLPMSFLVGADGRVRSSVFGESDWSAGELGGAVERLVVDAERRAGAAERRAGAAERRAGAQPARRAERDASR